jgi:hypothetical protein
MGCMNILRIERLIKYILLGLIVILTAKYIPETKLLTKEIIMIGATSSIAFAILDLVSPTVRVIETKNDKLKV